MENTKQYNKVVVIARVDPVKIPESSQTLFSDRELPKQIPVGHSEDLRLVTTPPLQHEIVSKVNTFELTII